MKTETIQKFEEIEELKKYFRKQLINELADEIKYLTWSEEKNAIRDGSPIDCRATAEDFGFLHCKAKIDMLLKSKV